MNGSNMNGSMVHGQNSAACKEYFWGCKLSKDNPEKVWDPAKKQDEEEDDDDEDFAQETLFLKHAVLDIGAVKGERNVIEVKTRSFQDKEESVTSIASLTLGVTNDMCSLNVNFNHDIPATFKLIEGSGPVCLVGQHLVEFGDDYEDLDMTEGDQIDDSVKKTTPAKRKASNPLSNKNKRGKIDANAAAKVADDEDDDEDEDEEDEPESEDDNDDDEEDSDEIEEEEEEMEEDSPVKKKKPAAKPTKSKGKTNGVAPEVTKKTKAAQKAAGKKSTKGK